MSMSAIRISGKQVILKFVLPRRIEPFSNQSQSQFETNHALGPSAGNSGSSFGAHPTSLHAGVGCVHGKTISWHGRRMEAQMMAAQVAAMVQDMISRGVLPEKVRVGQLAQT